jgi:hypothetical protein
MGRRFLWLFPIILFSLILVSFAILARPFSREAMATALGDSLASKVVFGTFRRTYLPAPGFVATDVKILPKQGWSAGHAEVAMLRTEATWSGLIQHQVGRITAEVTTVSVRSLRERVFVGTLGENLIQELDLRRATLQLGDKRFDFHGVVLRNIGHGRQIAYEVAVAIPQPAGELALRGKLGPFHRGEFAQTPLGGSYTLDRARLGVFQGLAGILSSQGTFSGTLSQLDFRGSSDTPDFEVTDSGHTHHLATNFQAVVNATNGDTVLNHIDAKLDRTSLKANGKIESSGAETEKTASLNIESGQGRIQDLTLLFIQARESPILGPVSFRAQIVLPPGKREFKQRVELRGRFGIKGAGFTSEDTQGSVDTLSERAEGEPREAPERVLSDLTGQVVLHDGVATLTDICFQVPGATANLAGTFSLITEKVDLHGKLATAAKLSKTTTGIKSVLLKVLDPVFKRKHAGAVIPVALTGKYGNTKFHEVLTK